MVLHNYFLHCGFSDIKLFHIYSRSNLPVSSRSSWSPSCEVLSQQLPDWLQSQIYSGSDLLFIPPLCPPWGCYFLGSSHAKTPRLDDVQNPSNLPADCVCHWEKEQVINTDLSRKARLQLSSGWWHAARLDPEWERMHQPGVHLRAAACTWTRKYLL